MFCETKTPLLSPASASRIVFAVDINKPVFVPVVEPVVTLQVFLSHDCPGIALCLFLVNIA